MNTLAGDLEGQIYTLARLASIYVLKIFDFTKSQLQIVL